MVLVEAALCGTPSVASDLPGVRVAIHQTGMGLCVPPRDAAALAAAVCEVIANRSRYVCSQAEVAQNSSPAVIAAQYEQLYEGLIKPR
jgi:glycosyltransferase involved in cell wall biosynthesis